MTDQDKKTVEEIRKLVCVQIPSKRFTGLPPYPPSVLKDLLAIIDRLGEENERQIKNLQFQRARIDALNLDIRQLRHDNREQMEATATAHFERVRDINSFKAKLDKAKEGLQAVMNVGEHYLVAEDCWRDYLSQCHICTASKHLKQLEEE